MGKKLVSYYDLSYATDIANKLKSSDSKFDAEIFLDYLNTNLGTETFLVRQDLYVNAFELALNIEYKDYLELFKSIWGSELKKETGMFTEGWWLWPIGRFVERHANEDPIASYVFIKEFTKRQTGEYAIRPLLIQHTELTMKTMLAWSTDQNVHVRRLASEGIRIHLPWAPKTVAALNYFDIYKTILTNLKNDTSKFIQKSVGNNLNDLYKENQSLADEMINSWREDELTAATKWIIKHGQRRL
ncbi:DNA alkylation repair protein [Alkalibacterium sp. 20]|uniref:DNA alkylation repair protein n=1 Tax=Alkalibacterium sp. 20 TaxID=1798803 RepID=UPI0008FFF63F|nr:DNA alkylation repair protein [Alkalibacterium sp. 20]OJF90198.1 hypothetical protein AX762_11955 [Alkalibacterium sp. 20]